MYRDVFEFGLVNLEFCNVELGVSLLVWHGCIVGALVLVGAGDDLEVVSSIWLRKMKIKMKCNLETFIYQ